MPNTAELLSVSSSRVGGSSASVGPASQLRSGASAASCGTPRPPCSSWAVAGVLSLLFFAVAACGSNETRSPDPAVDTGEEDGGLSDGGADADAEGEDARAPDAAPTSCETSAECRGGEICFDARCVRGCEGEFDCGPDAPFCDTTRGVCAACVFDEDCPLGQICDGAALACRPAVEQPCADEADCDEGSVCVAEQCRPVVCDAGARRCDASGGALWICDTLGVEESREACDEGEICEGTEGSAACVPEVVEPPCEANEIGCLDDGAAFYCDPSTLTRIPVPCSSTFYCTEGLCRPQVCEPSSEVCEADVFVTCDALGSARTRTDCTDAAVCASERGCVCTATGCRDRICAAGTTRCVGDRVELCSEDGTEWSAAETCGAETICLDGVCAPVVCDAGSIECLGETLALCNDEGTSRALTDCRTLDQLCVDREGEPTCAPPVCEADRRSCDPGSVAVVCDARGATETRTPCAASEYCLQGACLPKVCEPGSPPVCFGGDVRVCDVLGSSLVMQEVCRAGESLCVEAECVPLVCSPSSLTCDGETRRACSADGLRVTLDDCTLGDGYCDAGVCVPRACDPAGPATCDGGNVVGCDERGTSVGVRQVCRDGLCADGACVSTCGNGVVDAGEACDMGDANGAGMGCTDECALDLDELCGGAPCVVLDGDGSTVSRQSITVPVMPLDVGLLIDGSPSMGPTINRLATQFSSIVLPSFQSDASDLRVGVAALQDFPCEPVGSVAERPLQLYQRITSRTSDVTLALSSIVTLESRAGNFEMAGAEALYQAMTGNGRVEPTCRPEPWVQPPFDPTLGRVVGVSDGPEGGFGFRSDALRALVLLLDDASHAKGAERNGVPFGATWADVDRATAAGGYQVATILPSSSWSLARSEVLTLGARVGARVPPCFWDGRRPAGCAVGQCCTGPSRAGVPPGIDRLCALAYDLTATADQTVALVADAVRGIAEHAHWSVTLRPVADPGDATSPHCLVEGVVSAPIPAGGEPACGVLLQRARIAPGAGATDGFRGVRQGSTIAFDVTFGDGSCLAPSKDPRAFDLTFQLVTPDGYVLHTVPTRVVVPPTSSCGTARCGANLCGNGVREGAETCDDGNTVSGDGCSSTCQAETCGNGRIDRVSAPVTLAHPRIDRWLASSLPSRSLCDDGATCPHRTCDLTMHPDAPEHAICQALGFERATSVTWGRPGTTSLRSLGLQPVGDARCWGWICGDAPAQQPEVDCGVWELLDSISCVGGQEACDDGDANSDTTPGACRTDCTVPFCGDGIVDPGEECDDANDVDGDGCSSTCRLPRCGDGVLDPGEECDDGNDIDDDTCTNACELGPRFFDCVDIDLGSDVGSPVATGTNVGFPSIRRPSCSSGSSGAEVALLWTAPSAGVWVLDTDFSSYDTVLVLVDPLGAGGSCSGPEIACDDDGGEGLRSRIEYEFTEGETVVIVIDAWASTTTGTWRLNIARAEE